ncbi:MAG: SGNH/GDSL hydrolase family protein [Hydrococcus sp. Prado102]|jgi:phospholipase/lecithinase/hemolysin|nr:SGNH/GDSL hydrolase family protein [Hydrococcus sp. Prado102]
MNQFSLSFTKAAIALTVLSSLPVNAADLDFKSLYSFGDSLSDTGNFFGFSLSQSPLTPFPPVPYYSKGRFTNGSNWVDYVAKDLGIKQKTFAQTTFFGNGSIPKDGINFAFGGATTGSGNLGGESFLGLSEQIGAYTNLLGDRSADSEALYTIWAGANDYIGLLSSSPSPEALSAQISQTVDNLSTSITTLADKGARKIVVFNLPNLGDTPLAKSVPGVDPNVLNELTQIHNFVLAGAIDNLSQSPQFEDTEIVLFDVNSLFKAVTENPQAFGFSNVTDNCTGIDFPNVDFVGDFSGWLNCKRILKKDPKAFLFYDNQHPPTSAHKTIADSVIDTLESAFGDSQSRPLSQLSATSAAIEPQSVSVSEPTSVSVLGAVGLLFLGKMFQKRSAS